VGCVDHTVQVWELQDVLGQLAELGLGSGLPPLAPATQVASRT
jgi:hypothetical protein